MNIPPADESYYIVCATHGQLTRRVSNRCATLRGARTRQGQLYALFPPAYPTGSLTIKRMHCFYEDIQP